MHTSDPTFFHAPEVLDAWDSFGVRAEAPVAFV